MKKQLIKVYLRLWWQKHKYKAAVAVSVILIALVLLFTLPHKEYFYIDYNGNKGVATECGASSAGLWCDREFGGRIMVQEYWRED